MCGSFSGIFSRARMQIKTLWLLKQIFLLQILIFYHNRHIVHNRFHRDFLFCYDQVLQTAIIELNHSIFYCELCAYCGGKEVKKIVPIIQ
jgi:hypothetical protein